VRTSRIYLLAALLTATLGLTANTSHAQTPYTWKNTDPNTDWATSANWSPTGSDWTVTGGTAIFEKVSSSSLVNPNVVGTLFTDGITIDNSGSGKYNITGSGTLDLGAGGLAVSDGNTTITADLFLSASQTWNIGSGSTVEHSGILGGTGGPTLTVQGGGTVNLTGTANTFAGSVSVTGAGTTLNLSAGGTSYAGFTVDGGTLSLGGPISTGVLLNDGNLILNSGSALTFTGRDNNNAINGPGNLFIEGMGTVVTLTNDHTFNGPITIGSGATFQLGNGSSSASFVDEGSIAKIDNAGTLIFNQADNPTYAINGTGNLVKDGEDTLIFGDAKTYTGATTIIAGTLQLDGDGYISQSGTITVGTTIVTTATLSIPGSYTIGSDTAVPQTLQGSGAVTGGDLTVSSSTIRGGSPGVLGTLTIAGNLNLARADGFALPTLRVEVSRTDTSGPGTADASKISVTNGGNLTTSSKLIIDVISGSNGTTVLAPGKYYTLTLANVEGTITLNGFTYPDNAVTTVPTGDYELTSSTGLNFDEVSLTVDTTGTEALLMLDFKVVPVPEPAAVLGIGFGALALGGLVRRRVRKPTDLVAKA